MVSIMKTPKDMASGSIHKTKHNGDIEIISYQNSKNVNYKFVDTGFVDSNSSGNIRAGILKDKLRPSVAGVGFVGVGDYRPSIKNKNTKCYTCWSSMIKRCHNKNHPDYNRYGAKGFTVNRFFHNYQNFAKWYHDNYPQDGLNYEIDKDIKSDGVKEYSPRSCTFVTPSKNMREMFKRTKWVTFLLISPFGQVFEVENVSEFAAINGMRGGTLKRLLDGKTKSYKGWKLINTLDKN